MWSVHRTVLETPPQIKEKNLGSLKMKFHSRLPEGHIDKINKAYLKNTNYIKYFLKFVRGGKAMGIC